MFAAISPLSGAFLHCIRAFPEFIAVSSDPSFAPAKSLSGPLVRHRCRLDT